MEEKRCAICGIELDESSFYDDTCDDCAVNEGLLDTKDTQQLIKINQNQVDYKAHKKREPHSKRDTDDDFQNGFHRYLLLIVDLWLLR